MNGAQKLFLAGVAATTLVLVVHSQTSSPTRRRRRRTNLRTVHAEAPPQPSAPEAPEESPALTAHGLSLEADKLALVDWSAWMETAPTMLRATLLEGTRDPELVVANLFRRLFPETAWPPQTDSPLFPTWNKMVALVGRSLERPFKPHLEIVS